MLFRQHDDAFGLMDDISKKKEKNMKEKKREKDIIKRVMKYICFIKKWDRKLKYSSAFWTK